MGGGPPLDQLGNPMGQVLDGQALAAEHSMLRPYPGQACEQCRMRRIRCDTLPQCSSCSARGFVCQYPVEPPKKRGPKVRMPAGVGVPFGSRRPASGFPGMGGMGGMGEKE